VTTTSFRNNSKIQWKNCRNRSKIDTHNIQSLYMTAHFSGLLHKNNIADKKVVLKTLIGSTHNPVEYLHWLVCMYVWSFNMCLIFWNKFVPLSVSATNVFHCKQTILEVMRATWNAQNRRETNVSVLINQVLSDYVDISTTG